MDRFRILTLTKVLDKNCLSKDNEKATLDMLQEKIRVYNLGAEKRGKYEEVAEYNKILEKYGLAQ